MRSTTFGILVLSSLGALSLASLAGIADDHASRTAKAGGTAVDRPERFGGGTWRRGERLYRQNCASCHSTNLKGRGMAPALLDVTRRMADEAIVAHARKIGEAMCCARQVLMLTDDDFADIIAYLHAVCSDSTVRHRADRLGGDAPCCCSRGG